MFQNPYQIKILAVSLPKIVQRKIRSIISQSCIIKKVLFPEQTCFSYGAICHSLKNLRLLSSRPCPADDPSHNTWMLNIQVLVMPVFKQKLNLPRTKKALLTLFFPLKLFILLGPHRSSIRRNKFRSFTFVFVALQIDLSGNTLYC